MSMSDENSPRSQPRGVEVFHGRVDPRLLELLVCPLTRAALEYDRSTNELVSRKARLAYPIRDGIPIMLYDEARKLEA